jgi:hypothetical protein
MAVILSNKITSMRVKNSNGSISNEEYPIGTLAEYIAIDNENSEKSVQNKIDEYDKFMKL